MQRLTFGAAVSGGRPEEIQPKIMKVRKEHEDQLAEPHGTAKSTVRRREG